ncbi:hypothetical protein MBLNU230_g5011t1 [Neophaeotheca triangularis]
MSTSQTQPPSNNNPTLKPATRDDVPEILTLIHELAAYENATSSVQATETSLARTLTFAPGGNSAAPVNTGYAKCILVYAPSPENTTTTTLAGFALYFPNYSTWRSKPGLYLEDLFIRPAFRKQGLATLVMRFLAAEVLRMDGGRLEWSCLRWNEGALGFYQGLGAERMDGWVGLRVEGEALVGLARGRHPGAVAQDGRGGESV